VLRLGSSASTLLREAGQPQQRTRAWSWCVKGKRNRRAADVAVLGRGGRVQLVGSTAHGRSAKGVRVGDRSAQRRGVRVVRRSAKRAWVTLARGGRVRAVAVTTRVLSRRGKALRTAMARVRRARGIRARRTFVPNEAQAKAAGRLAGRTLAGTGSPRLNAALALLCRLQVQAQ
jgi:hypothetical protein